MIGFQLVNWLAETRGSIALRESLYVYPMVSTLHVLSLALFVGLLAIVDLSLIRANVAWLPPRQITDRLLVWVKRVFLWVVLSGLLLFYAAPDKNYENVWFRVKMLLILLAGLNILVYRSLGPRFLRWAGFLSLSIWLLTVIAGRLIAYDWEAMVWVYPAVQSLHLISMSVLFGAEFILNLRLLKNGAGRIAFLWQAALTGSVMSGALMIALQSTDLLTKPVFLVKMAAFAAVLVLVYFRRKAFTAPILLLWLVVGAAGRWIGFL